MGGGAQSRNGFQGYHNIKTPETQEDCLAFCYKSGCSHWLIEGDRLKLVCLGTGCYSKSGNISIPSFFIA